MPRAWLSIAVIATALLGLACRDAPAPATAAATRDVVDDLGRRVTVPARAERVLSLAPSTTEFVFALGAGDRLVGRSDACDFPPAAAAVPSVGTLFPPSYERILATRPDLVLMIDGNADVRRRLTAHGLPVVVVQPKTLDGILDATGRLGRLLGREAAAEALVRALTARRDALVARVPAGRPRVLYEVWPDPLTSAGPATFLGDLLRVAGGRNVVPAEAGDWPRLSMERVVAADPEVVLTARADSRAAILAGDRAGWAAVTAARTGRVVAVPDPDLLVRAGPRAFDGLAWLASVLHPAAFEGAR